MTNMINGVPVLEGDGVYDLVGDVERVAWPGGTGEGETSNTSA